MRWLWVAVVAALLAGCRNGSSRLLPGSGGKPYEVVVVSADSAMAAVVCAELEVPVAGLPQDEPSFDVSRVVARHLGPSLLTARNVVVVEKGGAGRTGHAIRVGHDVHASPQTLVTIAAPSAEALGRLMRERGPALRRLLAESELQTARQRLEHHHNEEAERTIRQMFGVEMLIPADLTSSKSGRDFLWLSNNSADAMQNVCVYIYNKGIDLERVPWVSLRDSVMQANIPGEQPGMYMRTADTPEGPRVAGRIEAGRYTMEGLWEMEGDMMGGPFVSMALADSVRGRIVVAEAFVYAPGRPKRNLIKALVPVVSSMSISKN